MFKKQSKMVCQIDRHLYISLEEGRIRVRDGGNGNSYWVDMEILNAACDVYHAMSSKPKLGDCDITRIEKGIGEQLVRCFYIGDILHLDIFLMDSTFAHIKVQSGISYDGRTETSGNFIKAVAELNDMMTEVA